MKSNCIGWQLLQPYLHFVVDFEASSLRVLPLIIEIYWEPFSVVLMVKCNDRIDYHAIYDLDVRSLASRYIAGWISRLPAELVACLTSMAI